MRGRSKTRFSPRASKRKNETTASSRTSTSEPPAKRASKRYENEQREFSRENKSSTAASPAILADNYCWICHKEADDDKKCTACHRAYHRYCLDKISASFSEHGSCPECQLKSVDGTELSSNKFFRLDKFKKILDVLTRRSFEKKKRDRNEIFLGWPEEHRHKLLKIIDSETLLDNIYHEPGYTKPAEFYSDVKFIYHNSCILYGVNSDEAKAAENLRKDFKTELLDLEACPECYYHLYCDESDISDPFVRICRPPHDIVWAQLTGHPYWPAKCLKVVKGIAHVRFFGEHEQSNIPVNKCIFISESHPKYKNSNLRNPENSGPKSQRYKSARAELLSYICLYERKYGAFPFHPHKTPYKPQEKQNEVVMTSTEGSCSRNMVMKLEAFADENLGTNVINAPTVEEFSGDNLISPSNVTGGYSTLDEIHPTVGLPLSSVKGGLNNELSPVTSIKMSFSSEENPSSEENNHNPVVTSIESLQTTESPPMLASAGDTSLNCAFGFFENLKGILHPAASEGTETIHCSEVLTETVVNSVSDVSPIQPDSLCNIVNNFPTFTGNQPELDDDICCIGYIKRNDDDAFNPDIVMPMLLQSNPELKTAVEQVRYMTNGLIINLWANLFKTSNVGRISKMAADLKKYKIDLQKIRDENDRIKKENTKHKHQIQSQTDELSKMESDYQILHSELEKERFDRSTAVTNARKIISCLRSSCFRKAEATFKTMLMDSMKDKEDRLRDARKGFEEERSRLEKELEDAKVAKQSAEDKLRIIKSQQSSYDVDNISQYKRDHYCRICETPANITCCLNTSYCSSKCQDKDAERHQKKCAKITSQSIVQQTVSEKTVMIVNMKESSTYNKSSNSNISKTDYMRGSIHKKAEIHDASSVALPLTSHDRGMASSFRSSSKSKRRTNK